VCYNDSLQHGCAATATCLNGLCVFPSGGACTDGTMCASGLCWQNGSSGGGGVCCNRVCTGECNVSRVVVIVGECADDVVTQDCSTGSCTVRTGAPCSLGTIACTATLKGFNAAGTRCQTYANNTVSTCDGVTATCSNSTTLCPPLGLDYIICGSAQCAGSCTAGTPASAVSNASVCLSNAAEPACPSVLCSVLTAGWSGNVCLQYASDRPGYCDATSSCSASSSLCTDKTYVTTKPYLQCGDERCVMLGTCSPGSTVLSFPTIECAVLRCRLLTVCARKGRFVSSTRRAVRARRRRAATW
jgi:hypothetical protein